MTLKFGSLFSGIGGFDLALNRAGMECAWQVEKDIYCQNILNKHWKTVVKYNDIKDVGKHNLEQVDLICGGFPCVDVSIGGKRAGLEGKQSGLWFEFERIIDELRPKWIIVENVPGLLSSRQGNDFETIIKALDKLGYCVSWRIFDSKNFGVAQRRRRVFIVASLGNTYSAKVLFEPESLLSTDAKSKKNREGITNNHETSDIRNDKRLAIDNSGIKFYNIHRNDDGRKDRPNGGMYIEETNTSLTIQTKAGKSNTYVVIYGDNKYKYPKGIRRLTPLEVERLQGFSDFWTDNGQSDTQRYKQLGNAVTVNVVEWIANRIVDIEKQREYSKPLENAVV